MAQYGGCVAAEATSLFEHIHWPLMMHLHRVAVVR